jgi:aquaporin Z
LYLIARGAPTFEPGTFAANGYAQHSPGGYELGSAFLAELVMTFGLAMVVLGSTRSLGRFAPLAIGLCYALVHWVTLPVTRTSVNPARSTGPALLAGDWALGQLWLFWLAPLIGAVLAGAIYPLIARAPREAAGRTQAAQEAPLSRDLAQPTT